MIEDRAVGGVVSANTVAGGIDSSLTIANFPSAPSL